MTIMQRTLVVGGLLAVGCLFLVTAPALARAEGDWSLPKLPVLKMPQLPSIGIITPKSSKIRNPRRSVKKASAFNKLTAGTRKFFLKTKEALAPWKKPTTMLTPPTGVRRTTRIAKPTKKKSALAAFFQRNEPEPSRRPLAPHDFIGLPRPEF